MNNPDLAILAIEALHECRVANVSLGDRVENPDLHKEVTAALDRQISRVENGEFSERELLELIRVHDKLTAGFELLDDERGGE